MPLETGHYEPQTHKRVTVWPKADKDGDGDPVWEDALDANGNVIGQDAVRDKEGNQIHHYNPPEGFVNKPSFDNSDNYVRVDNKNRIVRNTRGEAVGIVPGSALIEYPDGSHELLRDDYSQYLFGLAHSKVSAPAKEEE